MVDKVYRRGGNPKRAESPVAQAANAWPQFLWRAGRGPLSIPLCGPGESRAGAEARLGWLQKQQPLPLHPFVL